MEFAVPFHPRDPTVRGIAATSKALPAWTAERMLLLKRSGVRNQPVGRLRPQAVSGPGLSAGGGHAAC
jgi:hypothetical protein